MKKPATTCSPLVHSPCGSLAEREFHTSSILDLPRFSELTTSLVARDESMAFSAHVAHGCRLNKNLSVHGKNTRCPNTVHLSNAGDSTVFSRKYILWTCPGQLGLDSWVLFVVRNPICPPSDR